MEVFSLNYDKDKDDKRWENEKRRSNSCWEGDEDESRRDSSEMRVRLILSLFLSTWREFERSTQGVDGVCTRRKEKSEEENEESSQNSSRDVGEGRGHPRESTRLHKTALFNEGKHLPFLHPPNNKREGAKHCRIFILYHRLLLQKVYSFHCYMKREYLNEKRILLLPSITHMLNIP